ncbi:MAG: hypothetical protein WAN11_14050 [Syntrophobacteraceae bacterium]
MAPGRQKGIEIHFRKSATSGPLSDWKPFPSWRARQGQTAASQMILVGSSPRSMAFEGITWGE